MRRGLDDGWIRLAAWTEGTKIDRTGGDRNKNEAGEKNILPNRHWNERYSLLVGQVVVALQISSAPNDASWHGPLVDSKFQHQEQVQSDESNQRSGNHENMKRKKS